MHSRFLLLFSVQILDLQPSSLPAMVDSGPWHHHIASSAPDDQRSHRLDSSCLRAIPHHLHTYSSPSYLSDADVQDRYAKALLLVLMENVLSFFLPLSGSISDCIAFWLRCAYQHHVGLHKGIKLVDLPRLEFSCEFRRFNSMQRRENKRRWDAECSNLRRTKDIHSAERIYRNDSKPDFHLAYPLDLLCFGSV